MNVVCEVCGDIGFRHLLLRCRDCKCAATHQYCLEKVVYDASLIQWFCYECLQRHGEVTCTRPLEKVPSERPTTHAHFGSIVHQPITKRVESARDAGHWRNRKSKSFVTKYAYLNKIYSSRKKRTKNKSNMRPMGEGNCTSGEGRTTKFTAQISAKASYSCEIIGTESAKSNNGKNQHVDHENPGILNIKQPSPLIVCGLGTSGGSDESHLLEAMEELACKSKKTPKSLAESFKGLVMNRENVVLGSNRLGSSCSTAELGNSVQEKSKSDNMKGSGADHNHQTNRHPSVGCKDMEVKSVKDKKTVVHAGQNKYEAPGSLRNSMDKSEVHGDSNRNIIDSLMPDREKEEARFKLDYRANYELPQRSMPANVPPLSTLQNDAVDTVMAYSPNDGCEEVFSCPGRKNIPTVRERSVDSVDISSISQHDTTEASESSERITLYQKGSSYRRGKTLKKAAASSSSEESGDYIPTENVSWESDDLQSPLGADYVLSYRTYLSEAQKERVMTLIQEIQPEFTVYIATLRKTSVQLPGPYLGITKEYALAHFPDKSTNVTFEMPGKSKKWHPKFYKRDASRKNFLMGQWLDFVLDNHVQEGDIFLLSPTKGGMRSMFTVYLLHETATHSRGRAGFQRVGSCPVGSSAKMAAELHVEEEPTAVEHVSQENDMHEIPHESLESEDSDSPFQPPYIVPCKSPLSKSQKRIVEQRVRAIRSEIPLCVAVMKNNNIGRAQRWMLELGSRFGSVYLPTKGQTLILQCEGKTWEVKMMFHNGRRWFINGGWPKFALGNGLRVGDICLFELKKKEKKLTMAVHIIRRELF